MTKTRKSRIRNNYSNYAAVKLQRGALLVFGLVLQLTLLTGANVSPEEYSADIWRDGEEPIHAEIKFEIQKSDGARSSHSQLHHRNYFDSVRTAAVMRDRMKKQATSTAKFGKSGRPGVRREMLENVTVPISMADPNLPAYLTQFQIGTPPREFVGVLDTGSELAWVPCDLCINCFSGPRVFEPNASTSFENISCSSTTCTNWRQSVGDNRSCPDSGICPFEIGYFSGATAGILSSDVLTLTTASGQSESFPNFIFGCAHENNNNPYPIVGLNQGKLSIVSQLAPKVGSSLDFCFGTYYEGKTTELTIGSKGEPNLTFTGLVASSNFIGQNYRVNFTGVSVNGVLLPIPADAFNIYSNGTGPGALILDTGTAFVSLLSEIHSPLLSAVDSKVTYPPANGSEYDFHLCYDVTNVNFSTYDQLKFPNITFHISNLTLPLPAENTYVRLPPDNTTSAVIVCLAVWLSAPQDNVAINLYGNYQMQNYYFSMEPDNHRVGVKSGCS